MNLWGMEEEEGKAGSGGWWVVGGYTVLYWERERIYCIILGEREGERGDGEGG